MGRANPDRWFAGTALLAVCIPALAMGGARPDWQVWAMTPLVPMGIVLGLRTWSGHRLFLRWLPLLWLLSLALAAILQALSLGEWAVAALGGPGHRRADEVLGLLGLPEGHRALSLDPPGSLASAARAMGAAAILFATTTLSGNRGFRRRLLLAIGGLGVLETLLGILQGPLGLIDLGPWFDAPLGEGLRTTLRNPNHASALLNLAVFCWIALALDLEHPKIRGMAALSALATTVASLTTWSRAGGAVLVVLLALLPVAIRMQDRIRRGGGTVRLVDGIGLLTLSLSALLLLGIFEQALSISGQGTLLSERPEAKGLIWRRVLGMIGEHPWAGVGRGAFGAAFSAYNDIDPGHFFDFAENAPLQLLADLGLPLGGVLILTGLWCLVLLAGPGLASRPLLAVHFGVLAVLIHNLVDFSLEVPGVAFPVAALAGLLLGRSDRESLREVQIPGRAGPRTALAVGVALAVSLPALLSAAVAGDQIPAARQRLIALLNSSSRWERFLEGVQPEARNHPADPEIPRIAARLAARQGNDALATRLDEAALLLAPWHPGARRDRARNLLGAGRLEEAALLLRGLWMEVPAERGATLELLVRASLPPDLLARHFASPPELLADLRSTMKRRGLRGPLVAVLAVLRDQHPEDPEAWEAYGREAVEGGFLSEAEEAGWWLVNRRPGAAPGWYLLGRVAWHRGRTLEALALFREASKDPADPGDAALFEAHCLLALHRHEELGRHLEAMRPRVAKDPLRLARWHLLQASLAERQGAPQRALEALNHAIWVFPGLTEARLHRARLLREMGRIEEARREAREAWHLEPLHPGMDELLRSLGSEPPLAPLESSPRSRMP